jgi:hypothetical protein
MARERYGGYKRRARPGAREAVAEVTRERRRRPAVRGGTWPTIGP